VANRVAQLRADIEAAHPGAQLKHRGEAGFVMLRPDGLEEHRYTTGPWHWRQSDVDAWIEIDTDFEDRPDATWKHGLKSARFDTVVTDDGRRRFYPRRWIDTEYVEFGVLEYFGAGNKWRTLTIGQSTRIENRLGYSTVGADYLIASNGVGVRTHLVLESDALAKPVRWSMTLVGLSWVDGAFVSDADAETVGYLRTPTWTDATERNPTDIPWEYQGGYVTLTPDLAGAVYPVTIDPDYAIIAGADDGIAYGVTQDVPNNFNNNAIYVYTGRNTNYFYGWFRFQAITAAQDADCTAATIKFYAHVDRTNDTMYTDFYGVKEADHTAPTNASTFVTDHGIHTTATVAWDSIAHWTQGSPYDTPDLSSIFDELFSAGNSWVTGNDVGIHWDDGGSTDAALRSPASYENTSYTEPVLSLTIGSGDDEATPSAVGITVGVPSVTAVGEVNATATASAVPLTVGVPSVVASGGEVQTVIRPISDTTGTGWDSAPTGSQALYLQVDEAVASDTDYIYTTDPNP